MPLKFVCNYFNSISRGFAYSFSSEMAIFFSSKSIYSCLTSSISWNWELISFCSLPLVLSRYDRPVSFDIDNDCVAENDVKSPELIEGVALVTLCILLRHTSTGNPSLISFTFGSTSGFFTRLCTLRFFFF